MAEALRHRMPLGERPPVPEHHAIGEYGMGVQLGGLSGAVVLRKKVLDGRRIENQLSKFPRAWNWDLPM